MVPSWVLRNPDDNSAPTLDLDFVGNRAFENGALRLARDRETLTYLYLAPDVDTEVLASARIEPVFAGSGY